MPPPDKAAAFPQRVIVGVGEMFVSDNPAITLSTYALGSCVAVVVYDAFAKAGGMLHMMLPDSKISPTKALAQPAMFVDTGLPLLFNALAALKTEPRRLRIFVAGGASVRCADDSFRIGERNVRVTADYLSQRGLVVRQTAVGGTINRTVHLKIANGEITLKTPVANDSFLLAA
ncbi:MAG: chemotaxis protein CheD [Opitutaceae bacterium]|nr:chemotaxis protein CheD [Opitutaceae bacterium]